MKMHKPIYFLVIIIFSITVRAFGQQAITLDDIWKNNTFYNSAPEGFSFYEDGSSYIRTEGNKIYLYDVISGKMIRPLFDGEKTRGINLSKSIDDYSFSENKSKILLAIDQSPIYRHSTESDYFYYDVEKSLVQKLSADGKQRLATFDPTGSYISFIVKNDLYIKDIAKGEMKRITTDGRENSITNGAADWVYEEEFSKDKAYDWSPDGKYLAYLKFDESEVPEYDLDYFFNQTYPFRSKYKYPKVGEKNSIVTVWIYDVSSGKNVKVTLGDLDEYYIPRLKWLPDSKKVCVFYLNRHQSELKLLLADPHSGKSTLLFNESNKRYLEITDDLTFIPENKGFIWSSEHSGYNHLYLYDMKGSLVKALTSGNYDVTNFYGYDPVTQRIFYQAADESPLTRNLYSLEIKSGKPLRLNAVSGTNDAEFSPQFNYFSLHHSNINDGDSYALYKSDGTYVKTLQDNSDFLRLKKKYGCSDIEFFTFKNDDNTQLNGWMLKPKNFNPERKYPVLAYLYGGPGSQQVIDHYIGMNYWWFQLLAQNGYIVTCVDNRGTGARGEDFRKVTYLKLGHYETIDQIEAAKYYQSLPFVDPSRIGIFGWSYGGYMSSLCLLKGADTFKAAIAVAPVTNWKWYDSIYTERYMQTYAENPEGYDDNSPINFTNLLKGNYLLIHGMADDNVHFQNTVEMTNALIENNKQFETYFYPNRNHGIYGGNARLHLYTKMTQFILNNL